MTYSNIEFIFKDIDELITPVGVFTITNKKVRIPFSVVKNTYDVPYEGQQMN